jgi:hypothetical protein
VYELVLKRASEAGSPGLFPVTQPIVSRHPASVIVMLCIHVAALGFVFYTDLKSA